MKNTLRKSKHRSGLKIKKSQTGLSRLRFIVGVLGILFCLAIWNKKSSKPIRPKTTVIKKVAPKVVITKKMTPAPASVPVATHASAPLEMTMRQYQLMVEQQKKNPN